MVTGHSIQHRTWRDGLRRVAGLAVAAASAAVLADQVARALQVVVSNASSTGSGLGGPWWVPVTGVAVLVVVGALPAWRLVGSRPLAVFLAPCLGALVAGLSAVVAVVAGDLLRWFVAVAAAINAAALSSAVAPRDRREQGRVGPPWSRLSAAVVTIVMVGTVVTAVVGVATAPGHRGAGGRTSWMAMAGVLTGGHGSVHQAVTASSAAGARLLASPLASGAVSITWLLTRHRDPGAGDVVVAALTAAVVGVAACAMTELARSISHGLDPRSTSRPRARTVQLAGLVAAAGWALAAFGALVESGGQVDDSTVTLLWASAAVGAVAFGLVLSSDRWRLRTVVVLGAVSTLAAPAGGIAAAVVALLVTLRRVVSARRRGAGTGWWADALGGTVAVVSTLAWPVAAVAVGAVPVRFASVSAADLQQRLSSTWAILQPHLVPVAIAFGVAIGATMLLRRQRAARELGSDVGSVVVGAASMAAVLVAWAWPAPVLAPWRVAAVPASVIFPLLLASLSMATWMVLGTAVAAGTDPTYGEPSRVRAQGTDMAGVRASGPEGLHTRMAGSAAPSALDAHPQMAGPSVSSARGAGPRAAGSGIDGPGVDGAAAGVLHPSP